MERCPEAARILQDSNGRVPLELEYSKKEPYFMNFSVDLDSVYMTHKGIKVYELSRVKGEERNIFRLIVVLHFVDGTTKEFTSKHFQVQSKKNTKLNQGICLLKFLLYRLREFTKCFLPDITTPVAKSRKQASSPAATRHT